MEAASVFNWPRKVNHEFISRCTSSDVQQTNAASTEFTNFLPRANVFAENSVRRVAPAYFFSGSTES